MRTRQGVIWGIAAAATVGLVAASTVIPRAGSLLPVAVVVVGAGWATIGLVPGVVGLAARIGRRRPPRIAAVEEGVGHLSIVTRHDRTILAAIADHHSVPDHATGGTR